MDNNSEKVKKASSFNRTDVTEVAGIANGLTESIKEENEITEESIESLDQAILELIQMRKRHARVYMSLLRQGYTE